MFNPIENRQLQKVALKKFQLRTGQVLTGKIQKLFPGQKAQVQLGSHQLIAKLEAPLSLGAAYHFQVEKVTDMVYLKVLGEQVKNRETENTEQLLKQLHIKPARGATAFAQQLIRQQIPFDGNQLLHAIQLLNQADKKVEVSNVLSEMIARNLPITKSVMDALTNVRNNQLSEQMNQMVNILQRENNSPLLTAQLEQVLGSRQNEAAVITNEVIAGNRQNNPALFLLLKAANQIPETVTFQSWKSDWNNLLQRDTSRPLQQKLPFGLDVQSVKNVLDTIAANKSSLRINATSFIQQWQERITQAASGKKPLTMQDATQLSRQLEPLFQLLGTSISAEMQQGLRGNPALVNEFLQLAQTLEMEQTYRTAEQLLHQMNSQSPKKVSALAPNQTLLEQIKKILSTIGISYEHDVAQGKLEQPTIKEMLLGFIQEKDGAVQKQAQQLLHILNGMQLNSVQETENFIRAALLIPGDAFELPGDLKLEFEGRKTDSGGLNADYCRILFYLTLSSLGQTIVDMHVQNRNIIVTVYTDREINEAVVAPLKPHLKKGLEAVNYHLSGIAFKLMKEQKAEALPRVNYSAYDGKGVDFRI